MGYDHRKRGYHLPLHNAIIVPLTILSVLSFSFHLLSSLLTNLSLSLFFKNILFIYSKGTHRERQRHRQKEKQAPCGEPHAGLDPRTLGSHPEPKADAQPLSPPGVPLPISVQTRPPHSF